MRAYDTIFFSAYLCHDFSIPPNAKFVSFHHLYKLYDEFEFDLKGEAAAIAVSATNIALLRTNGRAAPNDHSAWHNHVAETGSVKVGWTGLHIFLCFFQLLKNIVKLDMPFVLNLLGYVFILYRKVFSIVILS